MKKRKLVFPKIQGAKDDLIDLGLIWAHQSMMLQKNAANPMNRPGQDNGILQFLVDTMNSSASRFNLENITRLVNSTNGKFYTADVKFRAREGEQTEKFGEMDCEVGPVVDNLKRQSYAIGNRFFSKEFSITLAQIRCMEEDYNSFEAGVFAEKLRIHLEALGREVANKLLQGGYVGNFANGVAGCKELPLFKSSGSEISFFGEQILKNDMRDARVGGVMPVLIGSSIVTDYADMRQYLVANNNIGIDLALRTEQMRRMGQQLIAYRDESVGNTALNGVQDPNRAIAIVPGAIKLFNMALNDLPFQSTQRVNRTVYVDPFYGLKHDIKMVINDCGAAGPSITFQISTVWDLAGYPDCWAGDDDRLDGITDAFCYSIICSDTSACAIERNILPVQNLSAAIVKCGPESTACDITCKALFTSHCQEYALFAVDSLAFGSISAVKINAINYPLGAVYDISTQAGADGLVAKLQTLLANTGVINQVSGGWETVGGDAEFYFVTSVAVTSIVLVDDLGADIDIDREVLNLINITDASTPSTGANYADLALAWTTPTTAFGGTPSESIFSSTEPVYGVMGNFYAPIAEAGSYLLDITDSKGCESQFSADTANCDGLTFPVQIFGFDDDDDDDTQDPAELGIQNLRLIVYRGITQVNVADAIVTDVDGLVVFNLEPGVYSAVLDETYGAAVGRTFTTASPKYFEVLANGSILWGAAWTEDGFYPVGPSA